MADYISREELIKALETDYNSGWSSVEEYVEGVRDEYDDVLKIVCGMKVADVRPVKHGKWRYVSPKHICCSCCDAMCLIVVYPTNVKGTFCPCCGARMDGEQNG